MGPDFEGLLAVLIADNCQTTGGLVMGFRNENRVDPGALDVEEPSLQAFRFGVYLIRLLISQGFNRVEWGQW